MTTFEDTFRQTGVDVIIKSQPKHEHYEVRKTADMEGMKGSDWPLVQERKQVRVS